MAELHTEQPLLLTAAMAVPMVETAVTAMTVLAVLGKEPLRENFMSKPEDYTPEEAAAEQETPQQTADKAAKAAVETAVEKLPQLMENRIPVVAAAETATASAPQELAVPAS